ncbi:hypothetical protein [Bacillus sp. alh8]|uniref:hypothetical protein n=1 Tax=Bacillus sp. alh8 TaxID=3421242 RepID=UPI003D17FBBF
MNEDDSIKEKMCKVVGLLSNIKEFKVQDAKSDKDLWLLQIHDSKFMPNARSTIYKNKQLMDTIRKSGDNDLF